MLCIKIVHHFDKICKISEFTFEKLQLRDVVLQEARPTDKYLSQISIFRPTVGCMGGR
jgi:hypothetical protein